MQKRTDNFQKFVKQKKGSAIKEELKQQKRKDKKERAAAIEKHFEDRRAERMLKGQPSAKAAATPAKPPRPNKYPKKEVAPQTKIPTAKTSNGPVKPSQQTSFSTKENTGDRKVNSAKPSSNSVKPAQTNKFPKKESTDQAKAPSAKTFTNAAKPAQVNKFVKKEKTSGDKAPLAEGSATTGKPPRQNKYPQKTQETKAPVAERVSGDMMPLNKYVAHAGTCSRRDAAIMVKEGKVEVNGTIATDPGMKVSPSDVVKVNNKKITPSRNFVYILLNKPKDYITTLDDPQGRKTVLELVRSATDERIYPVGRLDRNTSGVLLLTNDGELAQKLSHPSHEVKKVYEVKLDRNLTKADMDKIATGITLEDGFVAPDVIAYADSKDKSVIGIEIHSGRNRIVRRIFEHFKYDVKALDRVMFAGLTKKDVQRGKWRFLKDKELRILKFMNQSFLKVKA